MANYLKSVKAPTSRKSDRASYNIALSGANTPRRITAIAPVVDTMYLVFETRVTEKLLSAEKTLNENSDIRNLSVNNWIIRRAPHNGGFITYSFYATGLGEMEGVLVAFGSPREVLDVPGLRRVKVMIGSAVCWRSACNGQFGKEIAEWILFRLEGDLALYLPALSQIKVRRLDICIDHWGYEWDMKDLKQFSCRQNKRGIDESCTQLHAKPSELSMRTSISGSTFYIGGRGSELRCLRIYNKVAEAKVHGKLPWMEPIWRQNGWNGHEIVWRVEIEHGGGWLMSHAFDSVLKLFGCERSLWEHYLSEVRYTVGKNNRLDRRVTSEIWKTIKAAAMRSRAGIWEWRPRRPTQGLDVDRLIKQAAGCLAAAEKALGSFPWEAQGASPDDRRGEMLQMISNAMDRNIDRLPMSD